MSTSSVTPSCDHEAIARRLQEATGNVLEVQFFPTTFLDGDKASAGHLYWTSIPLDVDADERFLDDRQPEPLEVQLIAEMRRASKLYAELADKTEANLASRQEGRV